MKITDLRFDAVYNPEILRELEERFGKIHQHHVDLNAQNKGMSIMMNKLFSTKRRGEVVMIIPNKQGHIWLHTKTAYKGVYRLPTGGMEQGEKPEQTFYREIEEETGLKTKIDRCLAIITYTLTTPISNENSQGGRTEFSLSLPFVSYLFAAVPTNGLPHPTKSDEAITDFRAVPVKQLSAVALNLRSLVENRVDWGIFRAVSHEVAYTQLKS